jgi:hypothetical protein
MEVADISLSAMFVQEGEGVRLKKLRNHFRLVRVGRRLRTGCFSTCQKLIKRPGGMTG